MAVFLELPVPVIQWTNLWDKEKVNQFGTRGCLLLPDESSTISRCSGSGRRGYTCGKSVLCKRKDGKDKTRFSHSPSHGALLTGGGGLVCLTLDAQVHDVVPEDSIHKAPGEIPEKLINTCRSHSCPQQYPTPKEPLRSIFSPNVVIFA